MIKREFEKLVIFIESLPPKDISPEAKALIISKIQQTSANFMDNFLKDENFISNTLISNEHGKKNEFKSFLNKIIKTKRIRFSGSKLIIAGNVWIPWF